MLRYAAVFATTWLPVACLAQSGDWLGGERGQYETGTIREVWIDQNRDEVRTADPGDKRHLTIQIWYPATASDSPDYTAYAPEIADYERWTQENWGLAASRPTRSREDAELASDGERFPVLLYSHGFGNPSFSGTFQTEYLASHGYVVFSIGHSGWDGRVRFPDGYTFESLEEPSEPDAPEGLSHIERYKLGGQSASLQSVYVTGLEDIQFVIDEVERLNDSADSRFNHRLDLSRIGGLGFSNGGANYFQATVDEPRIRAAANLDGGLNGLSVLTDGARKPILLVQASIGYPTVSNGPADAGLEELFAEVNRETWQMLSRSTEDWYRATLIGAEHAHFTDALLIFPTPEGVIEPSIGHALTNRLTLEFFDRYLGNSGESALLTHEESLEQLRLVSKLPDTQ